MDVLGWDADQIRADFLACNSLRDLIASVEEKVWQSGRVVCGLKINGMALTQDDEAHFASSGTVGIHRLEVTVEFPEALINDSLQAILKLLPELSEAGIQAAEHLRSGRVKQGQELLVQILEGVQWFTESLQLIQNNAKKWPVQKLNLKSWTSSQSSLKQVSQDILGAMETQDCNLLADILEYDFSNSLGEWQKILTCN